MTLAQGHDARPTVSRLELLQVAARTDQMRAHRSVSAPFCPTRSTAAGQLAADEEPNLQAIIQHSTQVAEETQKTPQAAGNT